MVKTIHLTPGEVQHFVNVASKCDFDIDISYNRYIVDANHFRSVRTGSSQAAEGIL